MTTTARPTTTESCHWYAKDGTPVYEVPRATGQGTRPTTLADARKLGLLPSVTTILSILRKPQLETWLQEQFCLAVLTTPRPNDEQLDAFVHRVIHEERHQDQERDIAAKRGIEIHDSLASMLVGELDKVSPEIIPWVEPAFKAVFTYGMVSRTEEVLVGNGFAGRTDLRQSGQYIWIWDWKSTKSVPKAPYQEHKLQVSAYAGAYSQSTRTSGRHIRTGNVYISTVNCGEFAIFEHENWPDTFHGGFEPLLNHWQWANNYHP